MPNDEINQSIIDNIPTEDQDVLSVSDILTELHLLNDNVEILTTVKATNEMLLNRIELLWFTSLIIVALLIFLILRRTPK